jgi:hypothetical protein
LLQAGDRQKELEELILGHLQVFGQALQYQFWEQCLSFLPPMGLPVTGGVVTPRL